MTSVARSMNPTLVTKTSNGGIETLVITLLLPDYNQLQLVLIYRTPALPLQRFIAVFTQLLDRFTHTNINTIILGDFNEDIYNISNSTIVNTMSNHGFAQYVNTPTTDNGTLIDHVYCNKAYKNLVIQVNDTYYSDHDTIYLSIPLDG